MFHMAREKDLPVKKVMKELIDAILYCLMTTRFSGYKHDLIKKKWAAMITTHCFDNPKTNLTYEKNLYIFYFKYRAKSCTNILRIHVIKKLILSK
jgi:hypothetical protein